VHLPLGFIGIKLHVADRFVLVHRTFLPAETHGMRVFPHGSLQKVAADRAELANAGRDDRKWVSVAAGRLHRRIEQMTGAVSTWS
jgi:hypothetical protein